MANEITAFCQLSVVNGDYNPGQISVSKQITQNAQGAASGIQIVGTANEALTVGDVTTYVMLFLRNLDATNFVTYGSTAGLEFKLKAGEWACMRRTPASTVEIKADTAAVKVQFLLLQD